MHWSTWAHAYIPELLLLLLLVCGKHYPHKSTIMYVAFFCCRSLSRVCVLFSLAATVDTLYVCRLHLGVHQHAHVSQDVRRVPQNRTRARAVYEVCLTFQHTRTHTRARALA